MAKGTISTSIAPNLRITVLIWIISLTIFYTLFQMVLRNSPSTSSSSSSSDSILTYEEQSSRLYDKMERDLLENGPVFLKHGETSQSLSLSDLFTLKDGKISPALKVEAEAAAVKEVANELCPLEIMLDRVLLTSTGVLLGCWKVNSGDNPISIRTKLRSVLPRAPEKQLYDAAILHTSLARLLGPPISPTEASSEDHLQLLHELVRRLNNQIRGFKAIVSELWYVEEYDLLALALGGKMKTRSFPLGCKKS